MGAVSEIIVTLEEQLKKHEKLLDKLEQLNTSLVATGMRFSSELALSKAKNIAERYKVNEEEWYWFAARENTNPASGRALKILSRRMHSEQDALDWAEFVESQVKRKNPNHKYFVIRMRG